ncbi:hypothetical protein AB0G00_32040 [Nocardia salmonicida]|uniref:hypothetical protein n=1 Tax=Nocardia salmonicida TaxID=53431 RepID=UPI0033D6FEA9
MAAEKATTKPWWTSVGVGTLICVGCCAVPLLIAAGLVGGGSLLVAVSWLEPFGFALILLGGVGLVWTRARSRRTGCAGTGGCAPAGQSAATGCGCAAAQH